LAVYGWHGCRRDDEWAALKVKKREDKMAAKNRLAQSNEERRLWAVFSKMGGIL
jgi:hypothetical protein